MNETLFYVFGIGLTVLALIVSFVGLRWEGFPGSRLLMGAGIGIFVAFVLGTAVFGWANAEDEQEHREEERAEAIEESEAAGDEAETLEQVDSSEPTTTETTETTETTASADGAAVFESAGCGGCHTLAAAGTTGQTGPDLDQSLVEQTPEYIETAIVDPNKDIASGYPPDLMPQTYGEDLTPDELAALVQYLSESTSS